MCESWLLRGHVVKVSGRRDAAERDKNDVGDELLDPLQFLFFPFFFFFQMTEGTAVVAVADKELQITTGI